jgi:hypothetical protein
METIGRAAAEQAGQDEHALRSALRRPKTP